VQKAIGDEEESSDHRYPPKMIGELTARIHSIPTLWAQSYVDTLERYHPQLKNIPKGSAVWAWAKWAMTNPKSSGMWEPMGRLEAKIKYVESNPKIPYLVNGDCRVTI
jgi:hypothetical protein